jgi:hypothetical protein
MRLIQPFPGGTVEGARAHLVNAQGFAANVSNAPEVDTLTNLTQGIASAKKAAAELFLAPPRSDFQDLVAARQHVLEGAQLLGQAVTLLTTYGGVDSPLPQVKSLAGDAFDAFENAFEIIDND